jgi:hypothetical protein
MAMEQRKGVLSIVFNKLMARRQSILVYFASPHSGNEAVREHAVEMQG